MLFFLHKLKKMDCIVNQYIIKGIRKKTKKH